MLGGISFAAQLPLQVREGGGVLLLELLDGGLRAKVPREARRLQVPRESLALRRPPLVECPLLLAAPLQRAHLRSQSGALLLQLRCLAAQRARLVGQVLLQLAHCRLE